MYEIIPAILTNNKEIFKSQLKQIADFGAKTCQIDFTDGKFVNSKTLLPDELDVFVLSKNPLVLEAHLMTVEPEQYFASLYILSFKRTAVHYKSLENPSDTIKLAKDYGLEIGLALNPETNLDKIESYISQLDYILFLTVVPGEQGHKFEEKVLDKIALFNKKHPQVLIEVDGGMNQDNINKVISVGANRIVVGSSIWQAENPKQTFEKLQTIARE